MKKKILVAIFFSIFIFVFCINDQKLYAFEITTDTVINHSYMSNFTNSLEIYPQFCQNFRLE